MSAEIERFIRFAAVAEEMSFTRAARRLGVDQPWLSRQIQQLEARLGYNLFDRTTRQVSLTREGELLIAQARRLNKVAEETKQLAHSLSPAQRNRLRLGVEPGTYWMPNRPQMIDAFQRAYPSVNVETCALTLPKLLTSLEKGDVDIVISFPVPAIRRFDHRVVHRSPPILLMPNEDPLAKGRIRMADLAGRKLAVPGRAHSPHTFDALYGPFIAAGMEPVEVPEGRIAMVYVAGTQRICTLTMSPADGATAENMTNRNVEDAPASVVVLLARRHGDSRLNVQQFWAIAESAAFAGDMAR